MKKVRLTWSWSPSGKIYDELISLEEAMEKIKFAIAMHADYVTITYFKHFDNEK